MRSSRNLQRGRVKSDIDSSFGIRRIEDVNIRSRGSKRSREVSNDGVILHNREGVGNLADVQPKSERQL